MITLDKPMMDKPEIDAVVKTLTHLEPERVLEWGGGGSTCYYPQHSAASEWLTIEHDPAYFAALCEQVPPWVTVLHLALPEYYELKRHHLGLFDLIFVDGAPKSRQRCLQRARRLLRPSGVVILHDAHHPPYQEAAREWFARITELVPPNADGKRGLWLLREPRFDD